MEFRKIVPTILHAGQQRRLLDSLGEGKGGMIWENISIYTEKCILPYVKQVTSASSMHEARHSKQGLWDNQEGCGSGREGNMYTCGRFMLMYGKNHHNIVKNHSPIKIIFKKRKKEKKSYWWHHRLSLPEGSNNTLV